MEDDYNLTRFLEAQDRVYGIVLKELKAGEKRSHWMWYIFPQIEGLGRSAMAQKYEISSREEAEAYAEHRILGARLRECTQTVLNVENRDAEQIFGYPDTWKFRSCMTLFERSSKDSAIFRRALVKYFEGNPDGKTLDILERANRTV